MATLRAIQSAAPAPRTVTSAGQQVREPVAPKVEPLDSAAPPTGFPGDRQADLTDRLAGRLSVSSHTVSLSTRFFHLDYTWRSLDIEPPAQGPLLPETQPVSQARTAAPRSRQEVLRRMKLASLLDDPPPSPVRTAPAAPPAEKIANTARGRMAYFAAQGDA